MSHEPTSHEATGQEGGAEAPLEKQTRWLYARVLIVQAITLIALYWLQTTYGGG